MKTELNIRESELEKDYFPSLFANKDRTIIILADEKESISTFSGMIIHSSSSSTKTLVGVYSNGWTYSQFKRLPRETVVTISIKQTDV